jgi:hypothetical protein
MMDPSLCKDFNIFHPHNKVDYISQGNYLPNPSHEILSQVEMEWIQDLWKVLTKYINTEITNDDFVLFFKRRKEKTASSMSGQHLGHYKSITIAAQSEITLMADTLTTIINISIQMSTLLHRRQHCAQVMLEKRKGNYIENLCIIQFCEADLNFALHVL